MEVWSIIPPILMIVIILIAINSSVKRGKKITELKKEKAELELKAQHWQAEYQRVRYEKEEKS